MSKDLTLIEKQTLENYANPASPTFGNGQNSYLASTPNQVTKGTAATQATRLLKKPQAQNYVEAILERIHYGIEERSGFVAQVGNPNYRYTTETYNKDGELVSTVSKQSTPQQVLAAVDLANKADGLYNRARVAEHEAMNEIKEMRSKLKAHINKLKE